MSNLATLVRGAKRSDLIITPRLNQFLMNNNNLELDTIVSDRIYELLKAKPRDRRFSFSSSSAGDCERKQVYNYLGVEDEENFGAISPRLQMIFYDGTWRHLRWQAVLLQAGILTKVEQPLMWKKKRSRGTMDGAGIVPDNHPHTSWQGKEFGFELKGMNSWGYKSLVGKNEPRKDHLEQVHRYFLSGGFPLFIIVYENKDTQEWIEFVVEPNPQMMQAQKEELDRLNYAVDKEELPLMQLVCQKQTGKEFKSCQYGNKRGVCVKDKSFAELLLNPKQ